MAKTFRIATVMLLTMTGLTGVIYPAVVTAISSVVFPRQSGGSLIVVDDEAVGSGLIGQNFTQPGYFWGRLSATGPMPYNAAASSGSNFGPRNPALREAADDRCQALETAGSKGQSIPVDLLTASGSGVDPHISPAAAEYQVPRVATARGVSEDVVRKLVQEHTLGRQLGVLGEPRVNVLTLNLALNALASR
jgi:K+-transporting ATPase ATPase C chain